jgi:hypothetical protein
MRERPEPLKSKHAFAVASITSRGRIDGPALKLYFFIVYLYCLNELTRSRYTSKRVEESEKTAVMEAFYLILSKNTANLHIFYV